jgi:alkanesulfonate monooxygenase SsuD/methylene tetrahydromethanopterin reductase-like flavin-dependent oxidoreductase (luciferase family)
MKVGFRPMQGGNHFDRTLQQVELAESMGFDSAWLTEHHGWDISWPSPHFALAAMAARTETLTLGTSIVILPLANPVRLAGEFTLLDEISDGRAVLGAGLGYQRSDFEALDEPMENRVTKFVDNVRLVRRLWNEEDVDFEGKSFELSAFTLSPRPVQSGGPPIWCGGYADPALYRAARFGDEWVPSWPDGLERLRAVKDTYHEFLRERGGDPETKTDPLIRAVSVDEDRDEAIRRAREAFQPVIYDYLDGGYVLNVDPHFEDIMDIAQDRFIIGTPEEVTEQLERFVTAYDTDHLILKVHGPGITHGEVVETLETLGDEVLPHLQRV